MALILAFVFTASQVGSLRDEAPLDGAQTLHLISWAAWAVALLAFLSRSGGLLHGSGMRAALNDETTRDHWRRAFTAGFWAALAAAALVYATTLYEAVSAREGARLVITAAIAIALRRFGTLETRALKNG